MNQREEEIIENEWLEKLRKYDWETALAGYLKFMVMTIKQDPLLAWFFFSHI